MATRISQQQLNKFISPEAAMAPYERAQQDKTQRNSQDAALRQLIQGKDMDEAGRMAGDERGAAIRQEAIDANVRRAREEAMRAGMKPGQFSLNASEASFGVNPESDPLGKQIAQGLKQANITGYDVADPDRVIPSAKDAEEVKKATGSLKALQASGADVRTKLEGTSALDRFGSVRIPFTNKQIGTEKGIALDSGITDMVIQLKELANLGAITGPDMQLMESAMGNLTGIGSLIGDKGRAANQLSDVLKRARSKVETNATSRGYTPQNGYLDGPAAPKVAPSFEEWKRMKAGK